MADTAQPRQHNIIEVALRIGLVAGLILVCARIVAPFTGLLLWAVLLAVLLEPLHRRLMARGLSGSRGATLIGIIGVLLLAIPELFVGGSLVGAAADAANAEREAIRLPPLPPALADVPVVGDRVSDLWRQAQTDLPDLLTKHADTVEKVTLWCVKQAGSIATSLLMFLVAWALAAVLLAFKLGLSAQARALFIRASGETARGERLLALSVRTVRSVLQGVVGVAFIQAVLLGIGFFAGGVPFPGALTLVALLLGILQVPALVVALPAIAWVWAHADRTTAIVFTIWTLVAGASDNFLKPLLLGRGLEVPMPIILIGVIGGMVTDGLVGLFVGPVVLGVGYILLADWLAQPIER